MPSSDQASDSSASAELAGDRYGAHRVLEPRGALPQAAQRLDNDFSRRFDTEIVLTIDRLNLDATRFRQLLEASGCALDGIGQLVCETVAARGKQHNPVTGSGGMLLGTVTHVGTHVQARLAPGDRIASLVSLTLTPLRLDHIDEVQRSGQLAVRG